MKSIQELEKEIEQIREQKIQAVRDQNFEIACNLRAKERELLSMIEAQINEADYNKTKFRLV